MEDTYTEGDNSLQELVKTADCEDQVEIGKELADYFMKTPKSTVKTVIDQRNVFGNTPLKELVSCQEPSWELVSQLVDGGCDVNIGDNLKVTPLHTIVSKQFIPKRLLDGEFLGVIEKNIVEQQNQNEKEILKIVLDAGADVNKQDIFGRSPLFMTNDIEVIMMLIRYGADVNIIDKCGRTLLHCVLSMPNSDYLARFFLEKIDHKRLRQQDIFGSTLLHYTTILSRGELFQTLQNRDDASFTTEDIRRNTPADILTRRTNETNALVSTKECQSFNIDASRKKVEVVHFKEVVREDGAFVDIEQLKSSSEIFRLLHKPGFGAPFDETEADSVKSTIMDFAQYVCQRLGEIDPRLKSSLFCSGSSAEGTKIGDPTEFDFVFCLETIANFCQVLEVPNKRGFAELQSVDILRGHEIFFDRHNKCNATEIRLSFSNLLKRIVLDENTWRSPR